MKYIKKVLDSQANSGLLSQKIYAPGENVGCLSFSASEHSTPPTLPASAAANMAGQGPFPATAHIRPTLYSLFK